MLHIKEQFNSINSQKDTEFLDDSYFCLLDFTFVTIFQIITSDIFVINFIIVSNYQS